MRLNWIFKGMHNSIGFWILRWIKFQILIVSGISDSFSCIPDSEDQIPEGKIYQILDFTSKDFPDSGIRILLLGATLGKVLKTLLDKKSSPKRSCSPLFHPLSWEAFEKIP